MIFNRKHGRPDSICGAQPMPMKTRWLNAILLTLCVGSACQTAAAKTPGYTFFHLGIAGTLNGVHQPLSIGSVPLSGSIGTVLGFDDSQIPRAFAWIGNTLIVHYFPVAGSPSAISQNGAWASISNASGAYTCSPLGDVAGRGAWLINPCVRALGVNNSGLVVGEGPLTINGQAVTRPFTLSCGASGCGAPFYLYTLGGTYSSARAINNVNEIVGVSTTAGGTTRAFYINPGSSIPQDFDPAHPTYNSVAYAINDGGTTVGAVLGGPCPPFPTICQGSSSNTYPVIFGGRSGVASLGSLGGTQGAALSINTAGTIVGWSAVASGQSHGFLYSGGVLTDLNSFPLHSASGQTVTGWTITEADGINDLGQIVGRAISVISNREEVVVLVP
jgi:probable HAF family extracellular repeat protein